MADAKTHGQGLNIWLLWFGILGGPVVWALHETVSYLMVPYVCATGMVFLLHIVTIVAVIVSLAAGFCAFLAWQSAQPREGTDLQGRRGRNAFMGLAGLVSTVFFLLLILVESAGNYFFSPCEFRQGKPMGTLELASGQRSVTGPGRRITDPHLLENGRRKILVVSLTSNSHTDRKQG